MKSKITSYITKDKSIRIYIADTTAIVKDAVAIHKTSPISTVALGRTLTVTSIMGKMLNEPDQTTTVQIIGSNQIKSIVAVAKSNGNVKGYISNTIADTQADDGLFNSVGDAIGTDGKVVVVKDLGLKTPYIGQSKLVSGEIAEDMANYYLESEQLPTMVALGEVLDKDEYVKAAGGIIIQALPDTSDELLEKLNESLQAMPSMTEILRDNMSEASIIKSALSGFEVDLLESYEIMFECDCSREKMMQALATIDKTQLKNILEEDGEVELQCHFCNTFHSYSEEDLSSLLS